MFVVVLASTPKSWDMARRAHASHDLREAGPLLSCWACGGHSSGRQSAVLCEGCRGGVASTACKRLRTGLHPGSGLYLGPVRRWPGPGVIGVSADQGDEEGTCLLQPSGGSEERAFRDWDPRLALGLPHFWEDQGDVVAALPVGPPSASLDGTGSTIRRRFRFAQPVDT